jgi:hypothetical protein
MDERRKPFETEVPKHKKKSKKKGQPRADHKHEYETVVLHSWWHNPFKNEMNEHTEVCEICTICGRIGTYITGRFFQTEELEYDITNLNHWCINDYFKDKFAKPLTEEFYDSINCK